MNLPIFIPSSGSGIVVDLFAGGGGASEGIRMALGRDPDVAINHDPEAIAMHAENHPKTRHLIEDVWTVDPHWATKGRPVSLLWASPDCTHHSKAKGGVPNRDDKRRSLACVITDKWIPATWPETIIMENVEEFVDWGPLDANGCIIESARGDTFRWFLRRIRRYGYRVEYRELRACDYGAPTIRKRLFLIAKKNHGPVVWPEPTHGPGRPLPYLTAADCIDWSLPCPSIFGRKKPLADATCRRIAKGIVRYVINNPNPFIVNSNHTSAYYNAFRGQGIDTSFQNAAQIPDMDLIMPFLVKNYGGVVGHGIRKPLGTITAIDHHSLVAAHMVKLRGTCRDGQRVDVPAPTITASGTHVGLVYAFLLKYYGQDQVISPDNPLHTVTTKDRFGLVTVIVQGSEYVIADIGLRMLQPRELFRAQGFPESYKIDHVSGRILTKKAQVRMCGNSVCPQVASALIKSNVSSIQHQKVI